MRVQRRLLFAAAALLGTAAAALPAVAVSETSPTIVAHNGVTHYWQPATATVGEDGVVTLENPTEVPHGVEWVGGPAKPKCSAGVPVGNSPSASGTKWSGTCTFASAGVYTFYCTVHGPEMTGTVTVSANGTTTTTMTMPSGTVQTQPPGTTTSTPTPAPLGASPGPGSPLAGSASSAIRLTSSAHPPGVHGTVAVSQAGAGGRLEVELLAGHASLASAQGVQVGRTLRSSLPAGRVPFSVSLDARARRALRRARRLALTVRIVLTPPQGAAVTVSRSVLLRG